MTKEELEKEAEEYRESKRHKSFRVDVETIQINYESYLNNLQSAFKDGLMQHSHDYLVKTKKLKEKYEKRIVELEQKLEQTEKDLTDYQFNYPKIKDLEKENAELKEGLGVGSMWNKHLNSLNKELEEDRDKYRNMVFDKDEQLTKAKELLRQLVNIEYAVNIPKDKIISLRVKAEQFLKSEVGKCD